jgi:hypothetical protein
MIHELKLTVEIKNIHGLAHLKEKETNTWKKKLYGKAKKKKPDHVYFGSGRQREGRKDYLKALPYKDYLQTEHWFKVKTYVYKKFGKQCLDCGRKDCLNVHHETYKNKGDYEREKNDCVVLCGMCHAKEHGLA